MLSLMPVRWSLLTMATCRTHVQEVVVIDKAGPITKPRIEALSKSLKRELSSELV